MLKIKNPLKLTVGLGFTSIIALMGLISFISLSQMHVITEQMSELLEESNIKISAANTMRDSIRLRGDTLYKMYLTNDFFERDEYLLEMSKHALRYIETRNLLYSFHMSAREAKVLNELVRLTRPAKVLNDQAAQNMLSDLPIELIQSGLQHANKSRHDMLTVLNKQVLLQEKIARSIIYDTKKHQETISDIILLLSLATFFIAIYITQLVIRETSKKNAEIRFQATHDELTKLVNRKEFNHRLEESLKTAKENDKNHALCFLDLDKFKTINDSCGHKAGDELLTQLTKVIKYKIRSRDTLARLGGDEFGLLLDGCSLENAIEITEGIVNQVKNHEFTWQDKKFHAGISIGLVTLTNETSSVDKALTQADTACYAAKDLGRNQVHVHDLDDKCIKKIHKELNWLADINSTESSERFSLCLQEIKNIQTKQSTVMYKVLLRLNDGQGTLVSPSSYMPAAERFSLMKDVDHWVIERAFKYLSDLYKTVAGCDIRFFIKISANSLTNNEFSEFVIQQYKKYNIVHDAVCLEISEIKAVSNVDQTAAVISALRKYNIKFALNNFGSGISSFSYLKNLPVDYLKIDGDIIKNISQNTTDKAMVAAINQIGKTMGIETIAAHVEDAFTLNQLKEIGIDYAQGFYLDKPGHIDEQIEAIKTSKLQRSVKH